MGRKPKRTLEHCEKLAIANQAQAAASMATLTAIADKNLKLDSEKRNKPLTSEQCEALVFRVLGGETLGVACKHLSIDPAVVRNYAFINDAFSDKLARAYAHGSHALVEELLKIPFDDTLSDAAKRLYSDNIKWIASRINRPTYGDNIKVEHTVEKSFIPDFSALPPGIIDITPLEQSGSDNEGDQA